MRLTIAVLLGGLVMTLWGAFANMVVPIGQMSMRAPLSEDPILATLKTNLPAEQGIYLVPHFNEAYKNDPKAMEAFSTKTSSSPYAFIVYSPIGSDSLSMGPNILRQWISDTLAAFILALVMLRSPVSARRGLLLGLAFGTFAWIAVAVPFWNWYRFPAGFTFGTLIEQGVGWTLAGTVVGWWLGRSRRATGRPNLR